MFRPRGLVPLRPRRVGCYVEARRRRCTEGPRRSGARRRRLGLEAAAVEEGHGRARELRGDEANPAEVKWRHGGGRKMTLRGEARVSRGGARCRGWGEG